MDLRSDAALQVGSKKPAEDVANLPSICMQHVLPCTTVVIPDIVHADQLQLGQQQAAHWYAATLGMVSTPVTVLRTLLMDFAKSFRSPICMPSF